MQASNLSNMRLLEWFCLSVYLCSFYYYFLIFVIIKISLYLASKCMLDADWTWANSDSYCIIVKHVNVVEVLCERNFEILKLSNEMSWVRWGYTPSLCIQMKMNSGMHCLVSMGMFAQMKIIMHLFFSSDLYWWIKLILF